MARTLVKKVTPGNIYFDESGFTGNNLLSPDQPIFTYASVVADPGHAENFVNYLIKKYRVQGRELKGKYLLRHPYGKKAILEFLKEFEGAVKVAIVNKKYALAGKFFEYIFEPCISENNALFYNINFHKFISTILFIEFTARGAGAEEIFSDFERLMREKKFEDMKALFSPSTFSGMSPILTQISEFAFAKRELIAEELAHIPGDGAGKWMLDVTVTCLFNLLAQWGQKFRSIRAYVDNSQPIQCDQAIFDIMVGRQDRKYLEVFGRKQPITFNLGEPLILGDSCI